MLLLVILACYVVLLAATLFYNFLQSSVYLCQWRS